MTEILRANQIKIPDEIKAGKMPTRWDPIWPKYASQLSKEQRLAFHAMPEDLVRYVHYRAAPARNCFIGQPNAAESIAKIDAVVAKLIANLSGKTRAQIDAEIAAVSPNSPSAKNPAA